MRILVLASYPRSLIKFREHFISALCQRGHEVWVAAPNLIEDQDTLKRLIVLGVKSRSYFLKRNSMSPFYDFISFVNLIIMMIRIRPDAIVCYTIKPVIYGTFVGAILRVQMRYALVTGLGYSFISNNDSRQVLVRSLVSKLYQLSLKMASKVFFQNPDDEDLFRKLKLLNSSTPSMVLSGSGINLKEYLPAPFPERPLSFLLIGRLLGNKGIREYACAAKNIKLHNPEVRFVLVGGYDCGPDRIREKEILAWCQNGYLVYCVDLGDVRRAIASSHVFVLPSYREGMPRSVLEAMAMGRPIITTNVPGCKETVVDGRNGFLIEPKSTMALVSAIKKFIMDPNLLEEMGKQSRLMAESRFSVHDVTAAMLREMRF